MYLACYKALRVNLGIFSDQRTCARSVLFHIQCYNPYCVWFITRPLFLMCQGERPNCLSLSLSLSLARYFIIGAIVLMVPNTLTTDCLQLMVVIIFLLHSSEILGCGEMRGMEQAIL